MPGRSKEGRRREWTIALALALALALAITIGMECERGSEAERAVPPGEERLTLHPDIPRIDVHVHVAPGMAERAMRMMRRHGVVVALNASGGAPGEGLTASTRARRRTQGGLLPYCNFWNFDLLDHEAFPSFVERYLDACVEGGAVGLKIAKGLGLGSAREDGSLIPVDDPALDVLFEGAGARDLPVLIHSGDPRAFFDPPTPDNERFEELEAHPGWSFWGERPEGRGRWPSWEEIHAQYERRILRHPATTFIGAHFGNAPEEPERVASLLRRHPHYYIEIGARVPEIGRHDAAHMRRFFTEHADRILFGTDLQVGSHGLTLGSRGREPDDPRRVPFFFRAHYRYLETTARDMAHPTPIQGDWTIDGLGLSRPTLERLYYRNALSLFDLELPSTHEKAP